MVSLYKVKGGMKNLKCLKAKYFLINSGAGVFRKCVWVPSVPGSEHRAVKLAEGDFVPLY